MIGRAERLTKDSGCGPFEILLMFAVFLAIKVPSAFTMIFMAVGSYDPGWKCVKYKNSSPPSDQSMSLNDSSTRNDDIEMSSYSFPKNINTTSIFPSTLQEKSSDSSCDIIYRMCEEIAFDPGTSTVVTEWGLVCDKASYSSTIISIQMAGVFVGGLIAGHLGDLIGRKKTMYGFVIISGVLSFVTVVSPSWEVFAFMRFLMGIAVSATIIQSFVLPSEFMDAKWRARMTAFPSWNIGGLVFVISAMVLKNWKHMHIVGGVLFAIALIPAFWVPESLRWLEVKNKTEQFEKVSKKIISLNKNKKLNINDYRKETVSNSKEVLSTNAIVSKKSYNYSDLFRRGYRMQTFILAFLWFTMNLVYYAISFGVKSLYGNIYINLLIMYSTPIPVGALTYYLPNIMGRKKCGIFFYTLSGGCLLTATLMELVASEEIRGNAVLAMAMTARLCTTGIWASVILLTTELYPTCVRSIAMSYVNVVSRLGGILAPFLIPKTPDTLYICYLAMGLICVLCSLSLFQLPETKGKRLSETFEDDALHNDKSDVKL